MDITDPDLLKRAVSSTVKARQAFSTRKGWDFMGYVGAALVTERGNVFTGINLQLLCGIGFCAEHSAVAEMVRNGETRISKIVATTAEGAILPPCGRCRELLYQIDEANLDTAVIVGEGSRRPLRELLPDTWQMHFDKLLPGKS
jgi:cytidine deaminase